MTEPSKIVVTGGAGFIGIHLRNGLSKRFPEAEIVAFCRSGAAGCDQGDVSDVDRCRAFMAGADVVFHLAAVTRVPELLADPTLGVCTNIGGTACVLEAARQEGVGRTVLVSSGRVLGRATRLPATEELPLNPAEPYAVQKAAGELLARAYADTFGLEIVTVRPSSVYGRGRVMTPGSMSGIIPRFARAVLDGDPVTVVGDGSQRADFIHVSDLVDGLLRAADRRAAAGEVFHLSTGKGTTVAELVDIVGRAVGRTPDVERLPVSEDTIDLFLSNAKARRVLGFEPTMDLTAGLRDYVEWLREM